jgi:DNA ligase D-like protein (predicted ligase)
MNNLLDRLPQQAHSKLRSAPRPGWSNPMLAVLTEDRFSDPEWIFERKLDGIRCLAIRRGNNIQLLSRNRKHLNDHYPEVVDALAEQSAGEFVADGEIVAFDGSRTSFAKLQGRMQVHDPQAARRTGIRVFYYLFDLLHLDGHDLTGLELRHRKALLRRLLRYGGSLRYTPHRVSEGEAYWRHACGRGWEGVIAKRADASYVHGRSGDWLKFKCVREQEFVIGGYTDPKGSRVGLGALLVGYYERDRFRYAGKVGTGYNREMLLRLRKLLDPLELDEPEFADGKLPRQGVHWVKPELVGQVTFTEWTRDGRLRHPRFEGLREDKPAHDVVREVPR